MLNTEAEKFVHVAVAIIQNDTGQVLVSRRAADVHQANCWEYPGGKILPGESVFDALVREINEELGLEISRATPIMRVPYKYSAEKSVLLDVWRVEAFTGTPVAREGQPIQWCNISNLENLAFPQANKNITAMLQLPPIYGITPSKKIDPTTFLPKLDSALNNGLGLLQIRQPEMSQSELESFTGQVLERCSKFKTRVLVNTNPDHALKMGAHGVHMNSGIFMQLPDTKLDKRLMVAASCHNKEELIKAEKMGIDFVVLSPVQKTKSHPNAT
ncbi:MAG: Nudix family hydrolase, partial [Acidiferrobacterales bacterium]